ncbi:MULTISPECIES: hypothetical protein [Aeromonas]|uniref:hypothetical protein n=1 Tax=Aeromonas TaxID=642 RepID=UPI002B05F53F|nr:hypothetical protein [Aeromonas jandaei]
MSKVHLVYQQAANGNITKNTMLGWVLCQLLRVRTGTRPLVIDIGINQSLLRTCDPLEIERRSIFSQDSTLIPQEVEELLAHIIGSDDEMDVVLLCDHSSLLESSRYFKLLNLKSLLATYNKQLFVHVSLYGLDSETNQEKMIEQVMSLCDVGKGRAYSLEHTRNASSERATHSIVTLHHPTYSHDVELLQKALEDGVCVGDPHSYASLCPTEQHQLERFYTACAEVIL